MANYDQYRDEDRDNRGRERRYGNDNDRQDRDRHQRDDYGRHGYQDDNRGRMYSGQQGGYGRGMDSGRYNDDFGGGYHSQNDRQWGPERIHSRSDFGLSPSMDDDDRGYSSGMGGRNNSMTGRNRGSDRDDYGRASYGGGGGGSGYNQDRYGNRGGMANMSRGGSSRDYDFDGRGRSNFSDDSRGSGMHDRDQLFSRDMERYTQGRDNRSDRSSYDNTDNYRGGSNRGSRDTENMSGRGNMTYGAAYGSYDTSLYGSSFGGEFTGSMDEDYGYGSRHGRRDDDDQDRNPGRRGR